MTTKLIDSLHWKNFHSRDAAKEAIKPILDAAGIKSIECDDDSHLDTFIYLEKEVLTHYGYCLYSIWISNTYIEEKNRLKKVYRLSMRLNESFSMRFAECINKGINEGNLILTEEMEEKLKLIAA